MKAKKRRPPSLEAWYEIEEWIPPENARANVGCWARVYVGNEHGEAQVYREKDAELAAAEFEKIPPGRRFRLVLVSRKVISEKE